MPGLFFKMTLKDKFTLLNPLVQLQPKLLIAKTGWLLLMLYVPVRF